MYRAWRLQAGNLRDVNPAADVVDLFTMHTTVLPGAPCSCCRHDILHRRCDGSTPCNKCREKGEDQRCVTFRSIFNNEGIDITAEAVCGKEQRNLVVQLGRIKVDIMNRAPMDRDIKRWKRFDMTSKKGNVHCSAERTWIDMVSLTTWKERLNPSFDLGCLKVPHENIERRGDELSMGSVWTSNWYRAPTRVNEHNKKANTASWASSIRTWVCDSSHATGIQYWSALTA
jgi:hypothetical protein